MKQKQKVLSYIMFSLVSFVALSFVLLSYTIPNSYAHENIINIDVAGACTFSTGGGNYSVSMVDGSTEINANSITTSCNDTSGYAIYAVGYSGDSYTGNNTDLINTANSTYNIKTDGSSDTGSNWKLKFTVVSDATIAGSYNTYQNIPSTYTKVASYTNSTASGIITPHYQINLTGIQQPGTYIGQVKYVLVHPNTMSPTYTINYNANGGSGAMTSSTPSSFESFTLPTGTLTAPNGYQFAGWCTVQDANQSPQTTCSGNTYTNGATILASDISAGTTLNLYAVWEMNRIYMQDMTDAQCQQNVGAGGNATDVGDNITVYDKRSSNYASGDDGDYTVRWINGACWMTQNLRIQGTVSATDSNFTGSDFNVSQYDLKTNGGTSGECGSTYGYKKPCSRVPDSNDLYSSITAKEVGAWYNYYATTAGTISTNSNSNVASSDICPSGWHLPTGAVNNTSSEFYKLFQSTSTSINPNNYLTAFGAAKGGDYGNGSLQSANNGYWWSATANSNTNRYSLNYVNSNGQFSSGTNNRYYGYFIRCVKDKDYMQNQTASTLATMMPNKGDTATLYDKRDNRAYTVAKLADGKYWMTEDLNLAGGSALSAADTDVDSDYVSNFTARRNFTKTGDTIVLPSASTNGTFATIDFAYLYSHYYSWYAATLGSSDVMGSEYGDAPYSICPKGWRLPTARATSDENWQATSDFYILANQYGLDNNTTSSSTSAFSLQAGPGTVPGFLKTGHYFNGKLEDNSTYGYYWSATKSTASYAYSLVFGSSSIGVAYNMSRANGNSVRCLFGS